MTEKYLKIIKTTSWGPIVIIWSLVNGSPKINRILLSSPHRSALEEVQKLNPGNISSCGEIAEVASDINSFLEGEAIEFDLDLLDKGPCSSFQEKVLKAEYQIPRGRVSTYKLIARFLGQENGARAVGNALARNPFPIIIPCHRAIRSDGTLGGFQGGTAMKRIMLENEGLLFDENGILITRNYHYG